MLTAAAPLIKMNHAASGVLNGTRPTNDISENGGEHNRYDLGRGPVPDHSPDDRDRCQDQTEEKGIDRGCRQQMTDHFGKRQDGAENPDRKICEELDGDAGEGLPEPETQKTAQEFQVEGTDGQDQFFVDAENESDGAAGDPRDHIRGPDVKALQNQFNGFHQIERQPPRASLDLIDPFGHIAGIPVRDVVSAHDLLVNLIDVVVVQNNLPIALRGDDRVWFVVFDLIDL